MKDFLDECPLKDSFDYEQCSSTLLNKFGAKDKKKVSTCVDSFFTDDEGEPSKEHNKIFNAYIDRNPMTGLPLTVWINDLAYQGNMRGWEILEDICASLNTTSKACDNLIERIVSDVD
jgi:hypothetical protein